EDERGLYRVHVGVPVLPAAVRDLRRVDHDGAAAGAFFALERARPGGLPEAARPWHPGDGLHRRPGHVRLPRPLHAHDPAAPAAWGDAAEQHATALPRPDLLLDRPVPVLRFPAPAPSVLRHARP